ncbi:MAG TPA: filamentous hemagglutinin N-terminal domain-containing protein [Candidimonas sp.]|nr:filamentous hemagglutinin N-terminal domain-containing protein [Candidimonas sp.]
MNDTYRSITGFVLKALAGSLLVAFGSTSHALPVGGEVVAGSATVASGNGTMTVNQTSQNAALNWQSFNIGAAEAVRFVQPNSSSIALNRVIGSDPSRILGSLTANGKVFLVNPNGILFGKGASVNVGGLVASTRNITDSDFMAGNYKFAGTGGGSILNQGIINADGGYVALLSAHVANEGTISARLGTVALAAGDGLSLDVVGDGLLNVAVSEAAVNALVQNGGMIQADGGHVLMTAQAAGNLLNTVVNNTGVIQARTIENRDGVIKLLGDMQSGIVNVGGTLDASAPNGGDGGFIESSAAHVKVSDHVRITTLAADGSTGNWLIDPTDFIIGAGSGASTASSIGADTLSSALNDNNVRIATVESGSENGDIHVNSAVSWTANELTLSAHGDININATLNGSGTATLALEYGLATVDGAGSGYALRGAKVNLAAGNNFTTKLGSGGDTVHYMVITDLGTAGDTGAMSLQGINGNLAGNYVLGANIDASATSGWNGGAGFTPIGNESALFGGIFEGLGHDVLNLSMKPTGSRSYVGLFGSTAAASEVRNIGLVNVSLAGADGQVGALIGSNRGKVSNSYATGNVRGATHVGGLIGDNWGSIDGSYFSGSAIAGNRLGGLVGVNDGHIRNSYSTGQVRSSANQDLIGGLVGHNNGGTISKSYASAEVFNGNTDPGRNTGSLVGHNSGTVVDSYWNTSANSGLPAVGGGYTTGMTGLTEAQMKTASNFSGFNFTTTPGAAGNNWVIVDIDGTLNNAGGAVGATRPMLASEYSTTINNAHQLQLMAMAPAASYTLGLDINAANTAFSNDVWGSVGFAPISAFSGSFDGRHHTISGITINAPDLSYRGLFAYANSASRISNVGLVGGSVNGDSYSGSLVGRSEGVISNSYSTVSVNGGNNSYAGGLVGWLMPGGIIGNSYATGMVTSGAFGGGLVGRNEGSISNSYASGTVTGTNSGGLTGLNEAPGVVINSFWNMATSGKATSAGGTGLTAAAMMQLASFNSWNDATPNTIANTGGSGAVWRIYEGHTAPLLTSFMTGLTLTGAPDVAVTYNSNVQSGASISPPSGVLGAAATGTNAGFYNGYYSTQQGYDIIGGNLNISKADLTISTSDVSKTYDGALTAIGLASLTSGTLFGSDSISGGAFSFTDKNAGSGNKTVTATGVMVSDGNSGGNYNVTYADNITSTIVPKALTVAGVTALDKVYDGTTLATLAGGTLTGMISDDIVTLIEAGTFAMPNVGDGIAVTAALSLGGSSAGNYTVTQPTGLTANITAPVSVIDTNPPIPANPNAIASAISVMSVTPLQGDMANAQLPSPEDGIDASMPGRLAELNLTITGDGVRLRSMAQPSDARDDGN